MAHNVLVILGLAASLALGLLLNILACALNKSALPLISILFCILAPFPNIICGRMGDEFSGTDSQYKQWGLFITGFLIVFGFGIPSILAHVDKNYLMLSLSLAGGVIIYGTVIVYLRFFHKKDDEYGNI
eukprot:TRINITY_DN1433_c0_g1_i1.p1 TRINITY_DN1433_c0_g1~~TRINITY_DN1433_c0_g1_i1.p1  ORF type:complete len:129 (-),score=25.94 TRINITY_DN1433_c0_g1_i1:264-650(-)